jgi:hypothetical protein
VPKDARAHQLYLPRRERLYNGEQAGGMLPAFHPMPMLSVDGAGDRRMAAIEPLARILPAPAVPKEGVAAPVYAVGAAAKPELARQRAPRRPEPGSRGALIDIVV